MNNTWRKSSYSEAENECVELALGIESAGIRDSKNPDGGELTVGADSFSVFLTSLKGH